MIDAPITFDQPAFDPSETYTLQQDGSVMRGSDSASIPADAGNAAYRAFLAWQASGKTPAPVPAPPFSAGSVKAECGRRIYAVASDNAQKNMLATIVADGMSAVDKATFAAGVTWIAAMQASCRDMIVAADPLFADDAKWPAIPPGVAELAARFWSAPVAGNSGRQPGRMMKVSHALAGALALVSLTPAVAQESPSALEWAIAQGGGIVQPLRPASSARRASEPRGAIQTMIAEHVSARIGSQWVGTALRIAKIESGYRCNARNGRAVGIFQNTNPAMFGVSRSAALTCDGGIRAGVAHMAMCIGKGATTHRMMLICHNAGTPYARRVERAYRVALAGG